MDKSKIPTQDVELKISNQIVKVYSWLTQAEEDEYHKILIGDSSYATDGTDPKEGDNFKVTMKMSDLNEARKYLVTSLLANMTYEDFSVLHPTDREKISEVTSSILEKKG